MPKIAKLRRDHPDWDWAAVQCGFGSWRYIGERGETDRTYEQVEVYACSVLCGPGDDDSCVQWYARSYKTVDGSAPQDERCESFGMWCMRNALK